MSVYTPSHFAGDDAWQAFEQGRTVAAGGTDEIATVQWMERNGGQTTISREPRRR
ncbi:MAG: hypothetical protein ACRETF_03740 [Nevskiaceae bacterium]